MRNISNLGWLNRNFNYLNFFRAAFFPSISLLISRRFLVLRECLDFFFGLSVVLLFAIYLTASGGYFFIINKGYQIPHYIIPYSETFNKVLLRGYTLN